MRVVQEYADPRMKISVFSFNQKWLIKIEALGCEQTYKLPHDEVSLDDVRRLCEAENFRATVAQRFLDMRRDLDSWVNV